MCDDEYSSIEYLSSLAKQITEALNEIPDIGEWMSKIIEYNQETGDYPGDCFRDMKTKLRLTYPDLYRQLDGYSSDPDLQDSLFTFIFYPSEETYVYNEEEQGGEDVVYEPPPPVEIIRVMPEEALQEHQNSLAQNLSDVLCIHPDVAKALLRQNYWEYDNTMLIYSENPANALGAIGIPPEKAQNAISLVQLPDHGECDVCLEDDCVLFALPCGHPFCHECWVSHIVNQVEQGKDTIYCMMKDCKCPITYSIITELCGEEIANNYQRYVADSQISMDRQLCHCPRPGCPNVLTTESIGLCSTATCTCGERFCWKCRGEAHAPLDCSLIDKWKEFTKSDVMEAKWIADNTKKCPKCHTHIEKNGGCNHMTCQKCHYEFCWVCGHEWNSHQGDRYGCNKFTDYDGINRAGIPKYDLARLDHYHTRWMNHMKSHKAESAHREDNKKNLIDKFTTYKGSERLPPADAEELAEYVMQSIDEARSVIIWSYPNAFFMEPASVELNLFEFVQANVEKEIEEVTDLVEHRSTETPLHFRQEAKLLQRNTESLLLHVDNYSH